MNFEMNTAFAIFDGKVCLTCLVELNAENTIELGNADWLMDYNARPCVACWKLIMDSRIADEELDAEISKKADKNWDLAMKYETTYRKARGCDDDGEAEKDCVCDGCGDVVCGLEEIDKEFLCGGCIWDREDARKPCYFCGEMTTSTYTPHPILAVVHDECVCETCYRTRVCPTVEAKMMATA